MYQTAYASFCAIRLTCIYERGEDKQAPANSEKS